MWAGLRVTPDGSRRAANVGGVGRTGTTHLTNTAAR
jgi:hypothetical protein